MTNAEIDGLSERELAVEVSQITGKALYAPRLTQTGVWTGAFRWLRRFVYERRDHIKDLYSCEGASLILQSADFFSIRPEGWYCGVLVDYGQPDGTTLWGDLSAYGESEGEAVGRALLKIVNALSSDNALSDSPQSDTDGNATDETAAAGEEGGA